jgi:O-antigen ligase
LACLLIGNVASVSAALLQLIGRDSTLTNRTDIWKFTMEHPVNPLFGGGYLMYWDLTGFFELKGNLVKLRTAHNGYLDIFLDGGWVGVAFLTFMLLALGKRAIMGYLTGAPWGDLRFAFFLVMLVYNVSESMFARRTPLWFAFLLFSVEAGTALVRSETSDESEESWEPQTG